MSERHKYEYHVDLGADTPGAKILHMVGQGKRVLEIGAGPGSITRLLKEEGRCAVTAVEIDEQAIEKLKFLCERVYKSDLNNTDWVLDLTENRFQSVVAADVLEHLYNPWATLSQMKSLLDEDGSIVISLPHIGHNAVISCLLNADFEYQEWGLLDKTHIRFFSIKNMQKLFLDTGLKIIDAKFVMRTPEQTEFSSYWRQLPAKTRQILKKNKYGNVYQVVIKAVPTSAKDPEIKLMTVPVSSMPKTDLSLKRRIINSLKETARAHLSMKMRLRIAHLLQALKIKI